jgi:hypothetical protein
VKDRVQLLQVPDQISPIEAYRAWEIRSDDPADPLHPIGSGTLGASSWIGAGFSWVTASCPVQKMLGFDDAQVPDEDCSCGFYSVKSLETLRGKLSYDGLHFVLGRILLAGKVIELERGYRSERARIVELLPWKGKETEIARVAATIGVPLGPSVDRFPYVPPPGHDPSTTRRPLRGWVRTPLADCIATARAA